jgi:hypothetical protein
MFKVNVSAGKNLGEMKELKLWRRFIKN